MCEPCQRLPISQNNIDSTVQLAIMEVSTFLSVKQRQATGGSSKPSSVWAKMYLYVSLPTGYGKSMIYGVLFLVFN